MGSSASSIAWISRSFLSSNSSRRLRVCWSDHRMFSCSCCSHASSPSSPRSSASSLASQVDRSRRRAAVGLGFLVASLPAWRLPASDSSHPGPRARAGPLDRIVAGAKNNVSMGRSGIFVVPCFIQQSSSSGPKCVRTLDFRARPVLRMALVTLSQTMNMTRVWQVGNSSITSLCPSTFTGAPDAVLTLRSVRRGWSGIQLAKSG
mmetsp:Transcript_10148/g.18481  ORF Transcript_10148/g.18481 Transcript_10148/m.18481 type:complete len:205 (+) Transcript_10148:3929-4543(+)